MFYTIYKITNKLDGKIYIGKHQTTDLGDGYMGSGKIIKRAIDKHGLENFTKEILFEFDNEDDMNAKESELVTKEFVEEDTNYNICPGGQGGFGYINTVVWDRESRQRHNKRISPFGRDHTIKYAEEIRLGGIKGNKIRSKRIKEGNIDPRTFLGKNHTEETKQNMRKSKNQGSKNSQWGTMWVTNGKENKKIKKDIDFMPEGWYKGRVTK